MRAVRSVWPTSVGTTVVRGPELIHTRIVRCRRAWLPGAGSCCTICPRGDSLIGALVRVDPQGEAHRTQCLSGAIRRKPNQIRHLNFAGSYRHPHTDQRKQQERRDECRDEHKELAEAPDACANEHVRSDRTTKTKRLSALGSRPSDDRTQPKASEPKAQSLLDDASSAAAKKASRPCAKGSVRSMPLAVEQRCQSRWVAHREDRRPAKSGCCERNDVDHGLVLFRLARAGGVHEASSGPNHGSGAVQNRDLFAGERGDRAPVAATGCRDRVGWCRVRSRGRRRARDRRAVETAAGRRWTDERVASAGRRSREPSGSAGSTRRDRTSQATSSPESRMSAAIATVLPPGDAHRSRTRSPGCARDSVADELRSLVLNEEESSLRASRSGFPEMTIRPSGA